MKVKLSYTVDEEDVLAEAGKLWTLCQTDLKQVIDIFQTVPAELTKERDSDDPPNTEKCLSMIEEVREALLKMDTRSAEVAAIVKGYTLHRLESSEVEVPAPPSLPEDSE